MLPWARVTAAGTGLAPTVCLWSRRSQELPGLTALFTSAAQRLGNEAAAAGCADPGGR